MFTPERHLPTPGQHGHSPQRHTTAGTATPTTADTGNTFPQRANPAQTAYAHFHATGLRARIWLNILWVKQRVFTSFLLLKGALQLLINRYG